MGCCRELALAVALWMGLPAPSAAPILRGVTLNTKHGGEPPWSQPGQIAALVEQKPDIVFLQEASYRQLKAYLDGLKTGMHGERWHGAYARLCKSGREPRCDAYADESVMVLSRFPIDDTERRLLWAADSAWVARGVVRARLRLPDGRTLQAFSCHLPSGGDAARSRAAWVSAFTDWSSAFSEPQLVGGDFNATPGTAVARTMRAHYADAWTLKGSGPDKTETEDDVTYAKRMDYLFSSSALQVQSAFVPAMKVSDHRPVVATYTIPQMKR